MGVGRRRVAALGLFSVALVPMHAGAQAIERNLPPALPREAPAAPLAAQASLGEFDPRPIGPPLAGLVLLGPTAALHASAAGVEIDGVARIDDRVARHKLARFLGRPLSRLLIGQVQAEIVSLYRRRGFPFVSVSTPEQEISAGVLQFKVIEFHAGAIRVEGTPNPKRIRRGVRLRTGDPIDADRLGQDLDWLDRYPFRHVETVLTPGAGLGDSDLILNVTETRPLHLYAGYANSGSVQSTWDRYFLGGSVGGFAIPGSLLSYQFTASPDFFERDGRTLYDTKHPRYISHGGRFSLPVGERQAFEGSVNLLETNAVTEPFSSRSRIKELTLGFRTAISNYVPVPGDLTVGVEAKRLDRTTFFFGEDVLDQAAEVYQLYLGASHGWSDRFGRTEVAVLAHYSPGGVDERNRSDNFVNYSRGRVARVDYGYVGVQASRAVALPAGWSVSSQLIAQYALLPLPETEQMGLGGPSLVRGYALEDGSFDTAATLRTELHAPAMALSRRWTALAAPVVFLDAGHGYTRVTGTKVDAVSAGVGVDYQIGRWVSATVDYAVALRQASFTRCGDSRLEVRLTAGF